MKWQHIGVTLTGCAALITAGFGVYEKLNFITQPIQQKTKREYGIVDDKDGWVNLREYPNISAPVVVKVLNGTNLEIIGNTTIGTKCIQKVAELGSCIRIDY